MKHEPLPVGEKYLEIRIVGHNPIFVFRNKDYKNDNEPLFINNGVNVFVRTKKENKVNNDSGILKNLFQ